MLLVHPAHMDALDPEVTPLLDGVSIVSSSRHTLPWLLLDAHGQQHEL